MQKLYEITGDMRRALDEYHGALTDTEAAFDAGELDQEELDARYEAAAKNLEQALDEAEGAFEQKVGRIAAVIKNMELERDANEARAEVFVSHARPYLRRCKAVTRDIERLKAYALENMKQAGIDEIEDDDFRVALQINPPAVDILHLEDIPAEYVKTVHQPAKHAILRALKAGEDVPGAVMVRRARLAIKPQAKV